MVRLPASGKGEMMENELTVARGWIILLPDAVNTAKAVNRVIISAAVPVHSGNAEEPPNA